LVYEREIDFYLIPVTAFGPIVVAKSISQVRISHEYIMSDGYFAKETFLRQIKIGIQVKNWS
jgi:hypothetical protein